MKQKEPKNSKSKTLAESRLRKLLTHGSRIDNKIGTEMHHFRQKGPLNFCDISNSYLFPFTPAEPKIKTVYQTFPRRYYAIPPSVLNTLKMHEKTGKYIHRGFPLLDALCRSVTVSNLKFNKGFVQYLTDLLSHGD